MWATDREFRNPLNAVAADTAGFSADGMVTAGGRHLRRRRLATATATALAVVSTVAVIMATIGRPDAGGTHLPAAPLDTAVSPTSPSSSNGLRSAGPQEQYAFGPETATEPHVTRIDIADRSAPPEISENGDALYLVHEKANATLPPHDKESDVQRDTFVSGTAVRIDGYETDAGHMWQISWVAKSDYFMLAVNDQRADDDQPWVMSNDKILDLVRYIMARYPTLR